MTAFLKKIFTLGVIFQGLALIILPAGAFGAAAPVVNVLEPITSGISTPVRIATDQGGNFYLTDPRGGGVLKYNNSGNLVTTFPLKTAQGIAVTQSGDLIIGQGDSVAVIDSVGKEKFKLGNGAGQFKMANGIALDAAGYIYVVDSLDNCVQVFTAAGAPVNTGNAASGKPANSFGALGKQPGQFSMPTGITFEKISRQLAVVDTLNGRVQFFDAAGVFQKSIGTPGVGQLKFTAPLAVAFEYSKNAIPVLERMYVADSFQSNVQVIDPTGTGSWLGFIASYGTANGRLVVPTDAIFDPLGNRLLVVNGFGNVTVFGINGSIIPIADTTPPALTIAPPPAVTSSSTLVIGGTVEAGATITVTTTTAAAVGPVSFPTPTTWSATISALASGANEITVTAMDQAANTTTQKVTITFDALATNLSINQVTTPTNSTSQVITGSMTAGATITITTNSTAIAGTVTFPTPTSWSSTISGLPSGATTITVSASKTGSTTAVASVIITLDTTPPELTVSAISSNNTTSSQILSITGFTDPTISSVFINGQSVKTASGVFSTALLLASGANTITIKATDSLGNSTTDTRTIAFDPSSPLVTITSPSDGTATNANLLTVSGTAIATSKVTVNGLPVVLNGTTWSTSINLNQGIGMYTIEAIATDTLTGKSAGTKTTVFLNDLTKPPLALTTPVQDRATNIQNLPISGTTIADSVAATINGVSIPVNFQPQGGTFSINPNMTAEGNYTLIITAIDALGNSSSISRTIIYDSTPPGLAVTAQTPTLLTGTGDTGAIVTIKDVNGAVVATTTVINGSWNATLTGNEPSPLNISATDAAGNSSRNGDVTGNGGQPDISDAVKAMRIAARIDPPLLANSAGMLRGDVAPLVNGVPMPDGKIDIDDVMVILLRVIGLPW